MLLLPCSLLFSLLQRGVLVRMPLLSLSAHVEPPAQATEVIAECDDLTSLHRSLLHFGKLSRMPLTPLLVRVEPSAQAV